MLAMSCVLDSSTVSMIFSLLARSDEPVSVTSTMASASTGGFTSVAPQLNSTLAVTPFAARYRLVVATSSVAMILPSQVLHGAERRRLRHGQHPAHFAEALLGVNQIGDGLHFRLALFHPIAAGQAGVENAVLHVARHFLRADQHALDFGIVDRGKIRAAAGGDVEARAAEQIDGGVFQAALGNAELQLHSLPP